MRRYQGTTQLVATLKRFRFEDKIFREGTRRATSHPLWLVVFLTWDKISLKGSRVVISAVYQTSLLSFWAKRANKRLINFRHFCCEVWTFENDKLWKGGGNKIDILDLMLQTLFISSFVYDIFISSTLFIFPRRRSRKKRSWSQIKSFWAWEFKFLSKQICRPLLR